MENRTKELQLICILPGNRVKGKFSSLSLSSLLKTKAGRLKEDSETEKGIGF